MLLHRPAAYQSGRAALYGARLISAGRARVRGYFSRVIPRLRMTLPQSRGSPSIRAFISAGVLLIGSIPFSLNPAIKAGDYSILTNACLSRSTVGSVAARRRHYGESSAPCRQGGRWQHMIRFQPRALDMRSGL